MIADSVHFFGDEEQKAPAVGGLHLFEAMGSLRVKAFELGSGPDQSGIKFEGSRGLELDALRESELFLFGC